MWFWITLAGGIALGVVGVWLSFVVAPRFD